LKNQWRIPVILCFLLLLTLSCRIKIPRMGNTESSATAQAGQESAQNPSIPDESQPTPQVENTIPAAGETLYFLAFPVEVKDATGALKVIAARALKGLYGLDIIVILENTSSDPLQIYQSLDWQAKVFDAGGKVIGEEKLSTDVGFPPGQKIVLRAWVNQWEGDAERFELEIVGGKVRFIQEDMQDKFRALQMPSPLFTVEAQPFTLTDDTFFKRKVIRTQAKAVVRNPNPGVGKNIETTAVYFDTSGQIIGYAKGEILEIPAGGQVSTVYEGNPYFAGDPARAEYYAFPYDPYYIEDLFKMW